MQCADRKPRRVSKSTLHGDKVGNCETAQKKVKSCTAQIAQIEEPRRSFGGMALLHSLLRMGVSRTILEKKSSETEQT